MDVIREFEKKLSFKAEVKWGSVFVITSYHLMAIIWCYHFAFPVKWQTVAYSVFMFNFTGLGITGGVHRLWAHRSYKAKFPLQVFLLIAFASAGQTSIRPWVRNHRQHHKYSDTDADPHNSKRGLFFSHMGWLMLKKDKALIAKGKNLDLSDLDNDPLIRWYERNWPVVNTLLCFVFPTWLGVWWWGESWRCAIAWQCFIRYIWVLHTEFCINSLAHKYGYRPFNKNIIPTDNVFLSFGSGGEGFHNYHHSFPYDYRTGDGIHLFNATAKFIRLWERMGWAYDLKMATPEMVKTVSERLGEKAE